MIFDMDENHPGSLE